MRKGPYTKNNGILIKKGFIGFFAFLLIFFTDKIYAEPLNERSVVAIYNLKFTASEDSLKEKVDFNHYSYIIPEAISKKLLESGKYVIKRNKLYVSDEYEISEKALTAKNKYSSSSQDRVDYIVYGDYEISDKTIFVTIYIYSSKDKALYTAFSQQNETGIYLLKTTDELSMQIESVLDTYYVKSQIIEKKPEKKDKEPEKEKFVEKKSTFAFLEKPLSIVSLGFDYGKGTLSSPWSNVFNDYKYYSPFLSFDIFRYLSLGARMDYLHTDNANKGLPYSGDLIISSATAFATLHLRPWDFISIYLSAGGGQAKTKLIYNIQMPFIPPLQEIHSKDSTAHLEIGLQLQLSSMIIRGGALYKRIFYNTDPMDLKIIYAGAGIHF